MTDLQQPVVPPRILERPKSATGWMDQAVCKHPDVDPRWFFADEGSPDEALAKRVCDGCPVQQACLNSAVDTRETLGIWGGRSERTRRRIRRARRLSARQETLL